MSKFDWTWIKAVNWERVAMTAVTIVAYCVVAFGLMFDWFVD